MLEYAFVSVFLGCIMWLGYPYPMVVLSYTIMIPPAYSEFIRHFLKTHSGYYLESTKDYILETKLHPIMKLASCTDICELVDLLKREPHGHVANALLQIMTINETMFFRDNTPFDQIARNILPALTKNNPRREISIWCTACSSGQEPYSLAMLIDELRGDYPGWRFNILASDLSEEMIAKAKEGIYNTFEVERGLSEERRARYLTPVQDRWQVKSTIRSMVTFEPMNLMKVKPNIGPFDIVLCRNVLIYFDAPQKKDVLTDVRKVTRNGGYLLVGASEVLADHTDRFKLHPNPTWRGVYEAV